ncbi:MAG: hypothetical protein GY913_13905 [Proteobacteria bacterium]|nr:hypothetical protein [Pseudomonadota bacterium]
MHLRAQVREAPSETGHAPATLACAPPVATHTTVLYVSIPGEAVEDEIPCEVSDDVELDIQSEEHWAGLRWLALRSASETLDTADRSVIWDLQVARIEALNQLGWELSLETWDIGTADGARDALADFTAELDLLDAELDLVETCGARLDADAIALDAVGINVAEGQAVTEAGLEASGQVDALLERIRQLAVESSSETLDDDERAYLQDEFLALASEIDRTAARLEVNGVGLGDGTNTLIEVQTGGAADELSRVQVTLGDLRTTVLGIDTGSLDISSASGAQSGITTVDTALDSLGSITSRYEAADVVLESEATRIADALD